MGRGNTTIPAGIPINGGPHVSAVTWEGGTVSGNPATPTALITITHDAGNDLRVPLNASSGVGWVILDGGVPAAATPKVLGIACVRVSATTLRVTFASAPVSALNTCTLYYVYQVTNGLTGNAFLDYGYLGRGNAVTDNYSDTTAVAAPAHFDIGADLGSSYRLDRPLACTAPGFALG